MQCQPLFFFARKSCDLIEICTLAKTPRLLPAPWKATANAAEIEIEDFQDLVDLRLSFQAQAPAL